jgi:predicted GNAT family N-acyltransferase
MLRIKRMETGDIPFAISLSDQEDWGVTRRDIQRLMGLNPRGCFVAYEGITRIGVTTTTIYGKELGWIGNVIVDKDYRGKHIGNSLVEHAVSFLRRSSVRHIALYCFKEHVRFYENLGFVRDRSFFRLRRSAITIEHLKNQVNFQRRPSLARVIATDKKAFGADRSKLIRDVLSKKAGWFLGLSRDHSCVSYLMVREYSDMYEFGPWISIDSSLNEENEMIRRALAMIRPVPVEASCLQENQRPLQTLKTNDFRIVREGYRMFFKERAHIGKDSAQYALGFLDKG